MKVCLFVLVCLVCGACDAELPPPIDGKKDLGVVADASAQPDSNSVEGEQGEGDILQVEDALPPSPDVAQDLGIEETDGSVVSPVDATPVVDAVPPDSTPVATPPDSEPPVEDAGVPDSAPDAEVPTSCTVDSECIPGLICLEETCSPETPDLMVWCWDGRNLPDGSATCHEQGAISPEVWRASDYPAEPPLCQGGGGGVYPQVVECCRGEADWPATRACLDSTWSIAYN